MRDVCERKPLHSGRMQVHCEGRKAVQHRATMKRHFHGELRLKENHVSRRFPGPMTRQLLFFFVWYFLSRSFLSFDVGWRRQESAGWPGESATLASPFKVNTFDFNGNGLDRVSYPDREFPTTSAGF